MNNTQMRLKAIIKLAEEVGEDKSDWFMGFIRSQVIIWNEFLYQKVYETLISKDLRPIMDTTFPQPKNPVDREAVDGKYKIGTIEGTDIEFGLDPIQLQMHGVIGGGSGYGKSTLIKILCREILSEDMDN